MAELAMGRGAGLGALPPLGPGRYGLLAGLGAPAKDHLRFSKYQVGVLDALLAAQPEATCDALSKRQPVFSDTNNLTLSASVSALAIETASR